MISVSRFKNNKLKWLYRLPSFVKLYLGINIIHKSKEKLERDEKIRIFKIRGVK